MIPPRLVVAAIDFSDTSRGALAMAARLAADARAALHVLHAQDPLLATAAQVRGFDLHADTIAELDRFVADTLGPSAGPDRPSAIHVVTGPAGDVICDIALRERADLVVIGARGMGAAEQVLFGSTTESVLRKADVSVLVTPDAWTPAAPAAAGLAGTGPIVAAIDFAEPSMAAAAAAAALAESLNTTLELVHVVPALPVPARWTAHAEAAMADRIATATHELETAARAIRRGQVQRRVANGDVAEQLAAAAAAGTDRRPILVLGRRRRADRQGAPGAIAYRVLMRARVPVLVHLPDPSVA